MKLSDRHARQTHQSQKAVFNIDKANIFYLVEGDSKKRISKEEYFKYLENNKCFKVLSKVTEKSIIKYVCIYTTS